MNKSEKVSLTAHVAALHGGGRTTCAGIEKIFDLSASEESSAKGEFNESD